MSDRRSRELRERLGPVGVWTILLTRLSVGEVRETARRLEAAGYGSLWYGEGLDTREAFVNAAILLAATERIVVGTGIAIVYARDATATSAASHSLAEAWPGRFVMGLGVSHAVVVEPRGHRYEKPLAKMRSFLDSLDERAYMDAPRGASEIDARSDAVYETPPVLLAALGPKMIELGGARADGVHPYLVPTAHTAAAREILGPDRLLVPEQSFVLETDPDRARAIARDHVGWYLGQPNYRRNLLRLGYEERDLEGSGSDRLIDALVAWGSPEQVAGRVREQLDAGADHVLLQPLAGDSRRAFADLEAVAPALPT